ncbi:hypothetical protein Pla123a_30850 [Posidoniimonas polymericola]|uniref:LamG-like jellyroll fold domain-containing protein n=1 Tax=Posidoniimonas polymericola TaxID=2528002 RepID=A0A5C5YKX7_9BACT|nr:LamG domain-containing protein [Posidoniimonas polymericola]TWT75575.1 hypothetical protein Pla123a_30850 [Posidoniimonas polymericola]
MSGANPDNPNGGSPNGRTIGDADRLEQLLEQLVVATLEPQQRAELAVLIRNDPEAARQFAQAIHLRECLSDYGASESAGESAGGESGAAAHQAALTPATATLAARAGVGRCESELRDNDADAGFPTRRWGGWFPLALATCLALAVGLAAGRMTLGPPVAERDDAAAPTTTTTVVRPNFEVGGAGYDRLGRVAALSPDASSDGLLRPLQVGDLLRRGEVVQLTRGVMQVSFAAGPEVIVQGPAEFSVVDDLAIYVHRGRVTAKSPGRFTLQTSLVAAQAERAEVGVVADAEHAVELYAFDGSVAVNSNPHRQVEQETLRVLKADQGVGVTRKGNSTRLTAVNTEVPTDMVRDWAEVTTQLHPYEQLVLADRPLAYWPLYRVRRNRRVLDLTQHGYDGQAIGNWPAELNDASSTQVRGAYFDGESYIEPDSKPPVDLESGFTIEGWAKVLGGPEFQSVFTSRWVFGSNTPSQQCFGFTLYAGDDDKWQFWSGSGEYGAMWQMLSGNKTLERHRWTHVAASFRPEKTKEGEWVEGTVQLYVNGQPAASGTHRMSLLDFEWPARIGAAEFVPKSLTSWLFRGELRDVALYDYPLSDERIRTHQTQGEHAT